MDINAELLSLIQARQQKQAAFNSGILTADRYVKTIQECVGSDLCYRYAATKSMSFDDLMKKAAKTLVYSNDEMILKDVYGQVDKLGLTAEEGGELVMPKNTLMAFKHVLTSPKKDRDGDIMRTQGAIPDPKMLLLWQHVATLPIGKMLRTIEKNSKRLVNISAIVDMNALCHDAAVMVDNDMGRFSHGFRALEFNKMKDVETGGAAGFEVTKFEIMEESLVSIPSNTDAEVLGVIVGLVEGGKLTSPLMKSVGKQAREKLPVQVNVPTDVKHLTGEEHGQEEHDDHEHKSTKCSGETGCDCGCGKSGASKEENLSAGEPGHTEDKKMKCPKCGADMVGGVCSKCNYTAGKDAEPDGVKAGQRISAETHGHVSAAHDAVKEVHDNEHLVTKGGKALLREAMGHLQKCMKVSTPEDPQIGKDALAVAKQAMTDFIANATPEQRKQLAGILAVTGEIDDIKATTKAVVALTGM